MMETELWNRVYALAAQAQIPRRHIHAWLGATPATLRQCTKEAYRVSYRQDLEKLARALAAALADHYLPRSFAVDGIKTLVENYGNIEVKSQVEN